MEVRLHGDVGEDGPQRQGAVPGAAAARTAPDDVAAAGCKQVALAAAARDAQGKMRLNVETGIVTY